MRSIAAMLAGLLCVLPCLAQTARDVPPPLITTDAAEARVRLDAAGVTVERAGGRVRTTLDLEFANPASRVLEGMLQFPLQPGQQVVAFALDVDGRLRDAVPVEKARGRQVLEAIERRGADPGLLEQSQGEFFRLRIYPFAPHGRRHVRIVLGEADTGAVRLPVAFASELDALRVEVRGTAAPRLDGLLHARAFERVAPGLFATTLRPGDVAAGRAPLLTLAGGSDAATQLQTHRGTRYFSADLPIALAPRPRALPGAMTLLWDSSASGARRAHDLEFALLDEYFRTARTIDVELVRFRDVVDAPVRFHVDGGDWRELRRALESTVYDGATSLRGWTPAPGRRDVLLFSDGLFNYGDLAMPAFTAGQRLYAVRAGVPGDALRLAAMSESRGGVSIALDDVAALARARLQLLQDLPRITGIDALGAADVVAASPVAQDGQLHLAGRIVDAHPRVVVDVARGDEHARVEVPFGDAVEGEAAAPTWAQYRVARLMDAPERNRAAIARLGTDFGIVTPGSSLIVLERVEDYVRYGIAPPEELRAEYARLAADADQRRTDARAKQLDAVRAAWRERVAWWSRAFPKGRPPVAKPARPRGGVALPPPPPAPAMVAAPAPADGAPAPLQEARAAAANEAARARQSAELDRVAVTGSRLRAVDAETSAPQSLDRVDVAPSQIGIRLQPFTADSPFARRLRTLDADAVYATYLDERVRAEAGTAFYLDVADVLFDRHRDDLALRVLSNVAELDLDNRHVLRVLAYRLMQAQRADLAVPVLEQVLAMGDDEPQSYRDLALAKAALGERQAAVDLLSDVVAGDWDGRFPGIEITALAELNALAATSPAALDLHRVPADLQRNLPLDLRVVLSWDADATDMDLWVTDPNGEKVFYGHRDSYQGGHISPDFTGGYGPEEFVLRTAKPGRYKVEANYFGDRQQIVTGPPTLQLWLSTHFGTRQQKDQRITLRLRDPKETFLVGEFEVK